MKFREDEDLMIDGLDLSLDLRLNEDVITEDLRKKEQYSQLLDGKIKAQEDLCRLLEASVKSKDKVIYHGGFKNFLNYWLNTWYHTMILIFCIFLGYFIGGLKYVGLSVWKSKTSIVFYTMFSAGFIILTILEYLKSIKDNGEDEDGRSDN